MIRRISPSALPLRTLPATLTVLVLAAFVVLALARPAGACACGIGFGSKVGTERAVISLQDGREQLIIGLDLARPGAGSRSARRPAVLLPVPATPTVTALTGRAATLFNDLELATRPVATRSDGGDGDGAAAAPPSAGGVSVLSRERIGGYDVTRLQAGDAADLRSWLNRGGYATPAAAEPILRDYVRRGWAFVAIRLADAVSGDDQTLSPLRITFAAKRLVYPLRLSSVATAPVDVELYVAGEHRVVATGFDTYFAGFVSGLRPALPPEVTGLLGGRYLTRLGLASDDPTAIKSDVFVRQANSDRLFRASTGYPYETEANFARGPLPSELVTARSAAAENTLEDPPGGALWLVLFPAVGLAVLLVFAVLRLRERFVRRS